MEFDHNGLTEFLEDFATTVDYYESYPCSCSGSSPSCDCDEGFRYNTKVETTMMETAVNIKVRPELTGMVSKGMVCFTIGKYTNSASLTANPIHGRIKPNDVIVVPGKVRQTYDVLRRGTRDTLVAEQVVDVVKVYYNNEVVPAAKYSFNATTRTITWAGSGSGEPATGETYIVVFNEKMNYRVYDDEPQYRGSNADTLPKKVFAMPRKYDKKTNFTVPDFIEER